MPAFQNDVGRFSHTSTEWEKQPVPNFLMTPLEVDGSRSCQASMAFEGK